MAQAFGVPCTPDEVSQFDQWVRYYRQNVNATTQVVINVLASAPLIPAGLTPATVQLINLFKYHVKWFPNVRTADKRYALQLLVYAKNVCLLISSTLVGIAEERAAACAARAEIRKLRKILSKHNIEI